MKTYKSALVILVVAFLTLAFVDGKANAKAATTNTDSCSYQPNTTSTCDAQTNARIVTLTLQSGSSSSCKKVKMDTVPCEEKPAKLKLKLKKPSAECKYKSIKESECNSRTKARVVTLRLDRLKSPRSCVKRMLDIEPCTAK